jgi:hypothetical protein
LPVVLIAIGLIILIEGGAFGLLRLGAVSPPKIQRPQPLMPAKVSTAQIARPGSRFS